jgi:Leucine-rich repeat (LRR) protein
MRRFRFRSRITLQVIGAVFAVCAVCLSFIRAELRSLRLRSDLERDALANLTEAGATIEHGNFGLRWLRIFCGRDDEASFRTITSVELVSKPLSRGNLRSISNLHNVRVLTLMDCSLRTDDLQFIGNLTKLERLNLSHNVHIDDAALQHVGHLSHLHTLELLDTGVQGPGLSSLGNLTNLNSLMLGYRPSWNDPAQYPSERPPPSATLPPGSLRRFPGLRTLVLSNLNVTPEDFRGLPRLDSLSLRDDPLTDEAIEEILREQQSLHTLNLGGTLITDVTVKRLLSLPQLTTLDLSSTRVTGKALESMRSFPKLEAITLHDTNVSSLQIRSLRKSSPRKLSVHWMPKDWLHR